MRQGELLIRTRAKVYITTSASKREKKPKGGTGRFHFWGVRHIAVRFPRAGRDGDGTKNHSAHAPLRVYANNEHSMRPNKTAKASR